MKAPNKLYMDKECRTSEEEVVATVFDKTGKGRVLDSQEFRIISNSIAANLIPIVKKAFCRADYGLFYHLLLGKLKEIFKGRLSARDQVILRRRIADFEMDYFEIRYRKTNYAFDLMDYPSFFSFSVFREVVLRNEYSASIENMKNTTVVDCGANIGMFAIHAARLGAKKVYAFEPIKEIYSVLKKNIALNGLENVIIPINKAVGAELSVVQMNYPSELDGSASIELKRGTMTQMVEVTTIDAFLKGEEIGFIKMDVEGNEAKALLGAKETIRKYKPILSFSAYHRPEDKEVLPKIVKSIRPDYEISLNKFAEEDFFCR